MMKTVSTIIVCLLLAQSMVVKGQLPQSSINELKVLTWNVWYGFSQLEASAGILPADHPYIASQAEVQTKATDFLQAEMPDVLALQELKGFDSNKLSDFAASYGHAYSYLFDRDGPQATGITSKYPIEFLEGINGDYNGTNLEGTFAAKLIDEPFVFIVVHLKSANKNHREKETAYVLELFNKYVNEGNHVVILGDFNSMTISDREYAEVNIDKRLQYRIFKNKCKHELNRANEPDAGMAECTTWDYRVMQEYWDYTTYEIHDVINEYADRTNYETKKFWGTFPSSTVAMFHDESNLDHEGNPTTTHKQTEHLSRIDFILANNELSNRTQTAGIIHFYVKPNGDTVLIDEMTDHYPVYATFDISETSFKQDKEPKSYIYPNPVTNNILNIGNISTRFEHGQIYSLEGKKIKTVTIINNCMDLQNLNLGIYFLKIGDEITFKLVKM